MMFRQFTNRIGRFISKSNFKDWRNDGTPELVLGCVLSIGALHNCIQYYRQDTIFKWKNNMLHSMVMEEAQGQRENTENDYNYDMGDIERRPKNQEHYLEESAILSRRKMALQHQKSERLYRCKVRQATLSNMFDGSKSLMNVREGDVLDILEENIGPNNMYHLCRIAPQSVKGLEITSKSSTQLRNQISGVGWYPKWYLEQI
mmetsp:Transcript_10112/g.11574  ORF Transcript_10112/g.11574 Transcript_10112/m.11574 type:complete len:203 (+) Transcript_10112:61-669(+)